MIRSRVSLSPRRWVAIFVLVSLAGVLGVAWADPTGPGTNDRYVTRTVIEKLKGEHLTQHALDSEISRRMLTLFLKSLDPMKMYFYKSDVDAFTQRQGELVEKARSGDVTPAYTIFSIFLQRMDERIKMIDEILAQPIDLAVQEEMISDPEAAVYATNPAEALDRWRKRIKYDLLLLKSDKVEGTAAVERLTRRYHSLSKRTHQTNTEELLEMYLNALTSSFDPHTNYMSPSTVENFDIVMKLELEGIGAALQLVDGYTVVNKLIPGGAAEKDGRLKVEDKIIAVGQNREGEMVDVVDMKLSDVVKLIRGKRGTVVRLKAISADKPEARVIDIVREKIELKDSEAKEKIFEAGTRPDGRPYRVGVIKLPSFYMDMNGARLGLPDFKSTTRDVRKILEKFNAENVDALVLDLRGNGGGSLTEAINLTGLFISEGPVVQVKGPEGPPQPYKDMDPGVAWGKPMVVLVDKFSASASEILAGAIQDYQRGLIVGDKTTHGKGTVQSLLDLGQQLFRIPHNTPNLGALKITMQQFYRPNGDSTQNRGVVSDVELPSLTTHLDVGEADLEYSLKFDRVAALRFPRFAMVDKAMIDEIAGHSASRCAESQDFKKVARSIARYQDQKARKRITLNEKEFMEQRAELNTEKEEEKLQKREQDGITRDYYLDESLAITVDYLNLLSRAGRLTMAAPQR